MKKLLFYCCIISLLTFNHPGDVSATVFVVDADLNSISNEYWIPNTVPLFTPNLLDTGIDFSIGDVLGSRAVGLWEQGGGEWSDADGINASVWGLKPQTLVGQISQTGPRLFQEGGSFFQIGTYYLNPVNNIGRLYLGFADSDYGNNTGQVYANIVKNPTGDIPEPVVPEPATFSLLGLGLFGFVSRHRRRLGEQCV